MFVSTEISLCTVTFWCYFSRAFSTDLSPLTLIKEEPAIDMVVGTAIAQKTILLQTLS